jgi:predicted Zn-dependent protease
VALGETDYPLRFGWAPLRSVRAEGFKFIEAPRPELYDLQSDPEELLNRYEPWNARVQRLREQLAEIRARTPSRTISPGAIGAATIAELKALGYLGPADRGSATNVPAPSLLPDPKDKIVEQNLLHEAMLAADGNRPARAREALEKVLMLDPESYPALTQLGELELGQGQYAGAVAHFKRSRKLRPDEAATAYYEGQALERMRDFAGARDALEDSLKRAPGQFQARLLLGQVDMKLKDTNAASDQFEAALLLQPKSNEAQLCLAQSYIAGNKFEDAIARLQQLSRRDTQDPAVYLWLAQAYSGVGKKTEAQQAESRAKLLQRHNSRPEVSGVR